MSAAGKSLAMPSTTVSPISTLPIITVLLMEVPRRLWVDSWMMIPPFRDELFISTKAGYDMWPGPYGNWGSRKYLMASLDQSLQRMHLDYVDLFYSHRYDPDTPLEETLQALEWILYVVVRHCMWVSHVGHWKHFALLRNTCASMTPLPDLSGQAEYDRPLAYRRGNP